MSKNNEKAGMRRLSERMMDEGVLICPGCRGSNWRQEDERLTCRNCHSVWPVRNRVPDFFNRYETSMPAQGAQGASGRSALTSTIVKALDLAADEDTLGRVDEIVQRAVGWRCESEALTAEINDLIDRFAPASVPVALPAPAADANRDPRIRFDRHYLPEGMRVASCVSANVRVTNIGLYPWSSRSADGLVLAGEWVDSDQGTAEPVGFPVDIAPGRSVSVPMHIEAPSRTGIYRFRLRLHDRVGRAMRSASMEVPIRVEEPVSGEQRAGLNELQAEIGPRISDYGEDHAAGVILFESALKAKSLSGARILEVGSGTHPHLAWLTDYQVVAVDISSPLLELGSLYFADRFSSRLSFICADAFHPPFAPGSFDAVAMFSALHHFPEPEVLLERLARLLRPSGVLGVLCEPVGDTLEQPETVRDLLKGINEQVFSLDEYRRIFRAAGLHVERIRVDGESLKVALILDA